MKKKETAMTIRVDEELLDNFRLSCIVRYTNMSDVLRASMEKYIKDSEDDLIEYYEKVKEKEIDEIIREKEKHE